MQVGTGSSESWCDKSETSKRSMLAAGHVDVFRLSVQTFGGEILSMGEFNTGGQANLKGWGGVIVH